MRKSVIGNLVTSSLISFLNNGTTLPREPITLPYLTTEKLQPPAPDKLLPAMNILSAANFVAPYRLIGLHALSVERAMTFLTPARIAAVTTFSAPLMFVLAASKGLYSAV